MQQQYSDNKQKNAPPSPRLETTYRGAARRKAPPRRPGLGLLRLVLVGVCGLCLWWAAVNLHPDSSTAEEAAQAELRSSQDLASRFLTACNNLKSDALGNIAYVKKIYTIPENATVAPRPDAGKFGETTDPAVVQAVIDGAAELLDGQSMAWTPDTEFMPGTSILYYCDESILALCWKEARDGSAVTFGEVKIAHGSQFRRLLANNSYGSSIQLYPSDMAASANAVVAMNGDFYGFRQVGITVYQRQLYRNNGKVLDTCFITADGEMLFAPAGTLLKEEDTLRFIEDNDVVFSLSFGPILIQDGEVIPCYGYPAGEVTAYYSRSALGQIDTLHYLLATLGEEGEYQKRVQLNTFSAFLADKGCRKAYALDGGQTATMVFNGKTFNRVDYGNERTMSDIIYFATAIEGKEG